MLGRMYPTCGCRPVATERSACMTKVLFELHGVVEMLEALEGVGVLGILWLPDNHRLGRIAVRLS
jgi:hypothetical protein